jgi:hypothetical protein
MTRIVQISAIGVGAGKIMVFCLMEDGQMVIYDAIDDKWNPITMPTGYDKEYVGAPIATTLLPMGFELVRNNRTKTWTWRRTGSQAVPPPAIEGEVGEIFDNKDDALMIASKMLLKATETPP